MEMLNANNTKKDALENHPAASPVNLMGDTYEELPQSLRPDPNKIQLTALGLAAELTEKHVQVGETMVKVKPTVPYEALLENVQWAVNYICDDRPFISAPLQHLVTELSILRVYTNIDCVQFDHPAFLANRVYEFYDIVEAHDGFDKIKNLISKKQLAFYYKVLTETIDSLMAYRNSAAGVIERLSFMAKKDGDDMTATLAMLKDESEMGAAYRLLNITDGGAEAAQISEILQQFAGGATSEE